MKALSHPAVIAVMLMIAVFSLIGTSWTFAFGLAWPVRIAASLATIAVWAAYLGVAMRRRAEDAGGGAEGARAARGEAAFNLLTVAAVLALVCVVAAAASGAGRIWLATNALVTLALWAGWFYALSRRGRGDAGSTGEVSPPDAAQRRFLILHAPFVFALVLALIAGGALSARGSGAVDLIAVAIPVAVLAGWVWEFARMIRRSDEMVKAVQYRSIAISAGAVLIGAVVWSICESYLGWPDFPGIFLLSAWAVVYGVTLPLQGGEP